jgi:hypothetical protein
MHGLLCSHGASGTRWAVDWKSEEVVRVMCDVEQFIKVVRDGFEYAASTDVWLARTTTRDGLDVIERNLLYTLDPRGTDRGTRSPPRERIEIRHANATWLCEHTRSQIRGDLVLAE